MQFLVVFNECNILLETIQPDYYLSFHRQFCTVHKGITDKKFVNTRYKLFLPCLYVCRKLLASILCLLYNEDCKLCTIQSKTYEVYFLIIYPAKLFTFIFCAIIWDCRKSFLCREFNAIFTSFHGIFYSSQFTNLFQDFEITI